MAHCPIINGKKVIGMYKGNPNNKPVKISQILSSTGSELVELFSFCAHTNHIYEPIGRTDWGMDTPKKHNVYCADCGALITAEEECSNATYERYEDWGTSYVNICRCGHEYERLSWPEEPDPHEHSYSYSSDNNGTGYGGGTHTGVCSCGLTITEEHSAGKPVPFGDGTTHIAYCTKCGAYAGRSNCSFEYTGVGTQQRCTVCGHIK